MGKMVRIACLQLNPSDDIERNVGATLSSARSAVERGAKLILTPEHSALLDGRGSVMRDGAGPETAQLLLSSLRKFAQETETWILIGSIGILQDDGRIANRSYLIDNAGTVAAAYDKIHMFDIVLPDGREIRESRRYRPGTEARLARTPWGSLGMTICYDIRFPHLYRALAKAGAGMIAAPSAFTRSTGRDHWHALLRARAIESGAYILAPATCGEHPGGHATFGHSLVVDPWGNIIAEAEEEPDVLIADIDLATVDAVRGRLPSLLHDRVFDGPFVSGADPNFSFASKT